MEVKRRRNSDSAPDLSADARMWFPASAETLVARLTWLICRKAESLVANAKDIPSSATAWQLLIEYKFNAFLRYQ